MGMISEFKEFALKGNVIDMAVGVVIGAAFGAIVNSLVTDIFTPLVGVVTQSTDFSDYAYNLVLPGGDKVVASVKYGMFLNAVIRFVIVAFCLFMVVKMTNAAKRKQAVAPPAPDTMTKDQLLLVEIRDLLKQR